MVKITPKPPSINNTIKAITPPLKSLVEEADLGARVVGAGIVVTLLPGVWDGVE